MERPSIEYRIINWESDLKKCLTWGKINTPNLDCYVDYCINKIDC